MVIIISPLNIEKPQVSYLTWAIAYENVYFNSKNNEKTHFGSGTITTDLHILAQIYTRKLDARNVMSRGYNGEGSHW